MLKFSRLVIVGLILALPLLLALGVNPGIFTHDHSNVNQGGSTLNPTTLTAGGLPSFSAGSPIRSKITSITGPTSTGLYIEGMNGVTNAQYLIEGADNLGNGLFIVGWDGVIQTPSIGTAGLRTALGAITCPASSYCEIQLNDFAFFPSVQPTVTGCGNASSSFNQYNVGVDSGSYSSPQFAINNGCGQSMAIRYRYITSTDNPRVWIVADPSGAIKSVWAADDPLPNDSTGVSVYPCSGCTIYKFGASDFSYLASSLKAQYLSLVQQWIIDKGYSLFNLDYRIVQAAAINLQSVTSPSMTSSRMSPDDLGAPSVWINANAVINPATGHLCPVASPAC